MPHFETHHIVPHSAREMFDLVADVEAYPQFVPLCESLVVRARRADGEKTILLADMTVGYRIVRETFTSQVTLDPQALAISTDYIQGPFRSMANRWRFEPEGEGRCRVHFFIDYEFKSRTLAALMGTMFDRVFRKFAEAFEKRADEIHPAGGVARMG